MMGLLRMLQGWCALRRRPAGHRPAVETLEGRALPTVLQPLSHLLGPLAGTGAGAGYTPNQVRHAYGLDRILFGTGTTPADGSGQTIALVTAFDDPNLAADLSTFDSRFNLPDPSLTKVAQDGSSNLPATTDAAWAQETALDVEWAHAVAPRANLVVVEANSADEADLFAAVDTAARQSGVGIVSLSCGEPEFASELQADQHFQAPGVIYVVAAGDASAVSYPAASPDVLGVGGTTLTLDAAGNRVSERAWADGGGGVSKYEPAPSFQSGLTVATLNHRYTPDVAYDADPGTGYAVYDSFNEDGSGWISMGGTSAGAPQWAGLLAVANQGRGLAGLSPLNSTGQVLSLLYTLPPSAFYDVTTGGNQNVQAGPGYDLVTGLGSPAGNTLVSDLVSGAGSLSGPTSPTTPGPTLPPTPPPAAPAVPLQASASNFSEVAGVPFVNLVAVVKDYLLPSSPNLLTATITWGDGQVTSGSVIPIAGGLYGIIGRSTYAAPGSYTFTVTVTDTESGDTASAAGTASVVADPNAPPDPGQSVLTESGTDSGHIAGHFDAVRADARHTRRFPARHRHAAHAALVAVRHHRLVMRPGSGTFS